MRKKAPVRPEHQNEWFVASLTPAALSIFSDSFYPEAKRGEMRVFVAIHSTVNQNPNTVNVRIMNGFNAKTIRLMSGKVADRCLTIKRKVTKPEFEKIQEAITAIS
jgi:hypothetical protein